MRTVLVVEDEKLIRQGIATMIGRCGVEVEEILQCSNGLQAMDVLREKKVDVMFTDIRMPKMNGIELVQAMQELDCPPLTVAISGYDDFSYAVEMMRQGVREYILKPVERDKLKEIMEKLDSEISLRIQNQQTTRKADKQLIKYLLKDEEAKENELSSIDRMIRDCAGDEYCCLVCAESDEATTQLSDGELIPDLDGMVAYIIAPERALELKEDLGPSEKRSSFAGISDVYTETLDLKKAYLQARERREISFCREIPLFSNSVDLHVPQKLLDSGKKLCEKSAVSARVQLIGTDREESLKREWESFFTATRRGQVTPSDFKNAMVEFFKEYWETYQKEADPELLNPFSFITLDDYRSELISFIGRVNESIQRATEADLTESRIQAAIRYIKENYTKELNMAVVSNEVSMNYSLFSTAFKTYTGTNFVNFVKDLRMNEAKRLLSETDMKVNEISSKVGYDNEKHFMKSFKSSVGVSPSEYRKNVER